MCLLLCVGVYHCCTSRPGIHDRRCIRLAFVVPAAAAALDLTMDAATASSAGDKVSDFSSMGLTSTNACNFLKACLDPTPSLKQSAACELCITSINS